MINACGLGIDAGGTFTDAVVLDFSTGKVIAAHKAPTTALCPSVGIHKALSGIDPNLFPRIRMVSLATTFATNAMVEDRGGEAGLILIGYEDIPAAIPGNARVLRIDGGHTVTGKEKAPLDTDTLERKLASFVSGINAVAVAGFFSVRNPKHEMTAARLVRKNYALPVVRGHRLSMRLDAMKRAATAWWNARLIPIISSLIRDVRTVLDAFDVASPLMVVRGDGTLMSAETALDRPVDTLLSGPAASILGAKHLSGRKNAVIVDMGGTTTDMAALVDGKVAIEAHGAHVGKWKTHVQAAKVRTIGIGGDSFIHLDGSRQLRVGPRRAIPLCIAADQYPQIIDMLHQIQTLFVGKPLACVNPAVFYFPSGRQMQNRSDSLPAYMDRGLVSEYLQCRQTATRFSNWELEQLETRGAVMRAALTPTDIRIAAGSVEFGNREAAHLGTAVFAAACGMGEQALNRAVEKEIGVRLCMEAVRLLGTNQDKALMDVMDRWFDPPHQQASGPSLEVRVSLTAPVIGAGAPAKSCLPQIFSHLHTRCLVPDDFAVAVAVGAVVGMVDIKLSATIIPTDSGKYILYTEKERREFSMEAQAVENGRRYLETLARERMTQDLVSEPLIHFQTQRKTAKSSNGEDVMLEIRLLVHATGRPDVAQVEATSPQKPQKTSNKAGACMAQAITKQKELPISCNPSPHHCSAKGPALEKTSMSIGRYR